MSILDVFWWVVVFMIIVGYGDVYFKGIFGKLVGSFIVIFGLLVIVFLVLVIVMNFNNFYRNFLN